MSVRRPTRSWSSAGGESENDRLPIAVAPVHGRPDLQLDADRRARLAADVAHGGLEVVAVDDPVAVLQRLERGSSGTTASGCRSLLVGGIAYIAAVLVPRLAPR